MIDLIAMLKETVMFLLLWPGPLLILLLLFTVNFYLYMSLRIARSAFNTLLENICKFHYL
jgi:hypothetical protein